MTNHTYLLTGAAGFIGFHTARALLNKRARVIGVDSLTPYYDVSLKQARLSALEDLQHADWQFHPLDIADPATIHTLLAQHPDITHIIHLAAQAGVRYSIEAPFSYAHSNLTGQLSMLELARNLKQLEHFIYASSSSVYGANTTLPFTETDRTDAPVSLYAATKKSAELLAESYCRLYGLRATGLRFFTVYGAYGRPDMAYFKFTRALRDNLPITVYNHGKMRRDFTYIDDIVDGIIGAAHYQTAQTPAHEIFNLGNSQTETLTDMIALLETALHTKATLDLQPMQPGDMVETYANISKAHNAFGYSPKTNLQDGLKQFVSWYEQFYG